MVTWMLCDLKTGQSDPSSYIPHTIIIIMIHVQVSVFSPSPRKHYLNITLDNIVRIYPFSCGSIRNSVATQSLVS